MIVSRNHKFIFIKTRKTAGTSVQGALERICGPDVIVTRTGIDDPSYRPRNSRGRVDPRPYLFGKPRQHRVGRILKRALTGERIFDHMLLCELFAHPETQAWRGYFKFCFERNPWDKTVSRYFWKYRDKPHRPDFDSFVAAGKHVSDFDFYNLNREVAVDYVGRYEDLHGSLARIADAIGCETPLPGFRNAATCKKRDYRGMYSHASRDIVAEAFAREIAALGYSFDPAGGDSSV